MAVARAATSPPTRSSIPTGARKADSTGRRNTSIVEVSRWRRCGSGSGRFALYRGQMPSPGRPTVAWREDRVRFWAAIARGREDRGRGGGGRRVVAGGVPVVPPRWRRESVSASRRCRAATCRSPSVRRSRSAGAEGHGVREIARRLGRSPSTISRELRRNASTRTYRLEYRASIAQWHAERRARRPKAAKLVANDRLREYVQDRLAGVVRSADGRACRPGGPGVEGAEQAASGGSPLGARRGARSRSRTGCRSTSPMMSRCGSATRRSTRRSTSRAAARSSASWSRACAPDGRCGCRGPGPDRRRGRTSRRR